MIAIVIPWTSREPGGVSRVVSEVARQWLAQGVAHRLIVDDWPSLRPHQHHGELYYRVGAVVAWQGLLSWLKWCLLLPAVLWRLRRFLLQHAPSGLNFHYPGCNVAGVALLKRWGLYRGRLVLSFHGTDVRAPQTPAEQRLWSWIWQAADAATACSADLLRRLVAAHPQAAKLAEVAYNGVDHERFRPLEASDPPAPHPRAYGVSIGGHIERKRHAVLIKAYASCGSSIKDDLVIIGGQGPTLETSRKLVNELGLSHRVHLLVDRSPPEVALWLKHAGWAVLPSKSEGFPLAVLEAAACGVPMAISRIGGHTEMVVDKITGLLFEADDIADCANALSALTADPAIAAQRAEVLRDEVLERFTWGRLAQQLLDLQEGTPAKG